MKKIAIKRQILPFYQGIIPYPTANITNRIGQYLKYGRKLIQL